ncbi:hypothetical protein H4J58_16980 [Colwellia sp. MB3u-70]|nr:MULTISPECIES: hypothetical protein [unclassified Colwellia]MBA6292719.1 hypothetical protein [Colwellia sp. MB3u-8]MBA6308809.1 hypothetical protein [Colwellia sp. MB3u-70]
MKKSMVVTDLISVENQSENLAPRGELSTSNMCYKYHKRQINRIHLIAIN